MREQIKYLHNSGGSLEAVQIPASLWRRLEPLLKQLPPEINCPAGDFQGFQEFLEAWTFPYAYEPSVICPNCHAKTADWRTDNNKPFRLASANISGHLVFHCNQCGGTIRHKYFKNHMATEFTAPACDAQDASK